nr:hypothetical protein [Tanacetum cinerariifolium]
MSAFGDFTITYTAVSSPFGGLLDLGYPGVGGPSVMPEDPYAYVVAAFQAPPSPNYVPCLEYPPSPEFVPEPIIDTPAAESNPDEDPKDDPEEVSIILLTKETRAMMRMSHPMMMRIMILIFKGVRRRMST